MKHFSNRFEKVMELANEQAHYNQHKHVEPEHILLAFAINWDGLGVTALNNLGVSPQSIFSKLESKVKKESGQVPVEGKEFSFRALRILWDAEMWARRLGHAYIGTEHLLLGMLSTESFAHDVLSSIAVDGVRYLEFGMVKDEIIKLLDPPPMIAEKSSFDIQKVRKGIVINFEGKEGKNFDELRMLLREISKIPAEKEITSLIFYVKQ